MTRVDGGQSRRSTPTSRVTLFHRSGIAVVLEVNQSGRLESGTPVLAESVLESHVASVSWDNLAACATTAPGS
jgi:hypothetical protein